MNYDKLAYLDKISVSFRKKHTPAHSIQCFKYAMAEKDKKFQFRANNFRAQNFRLNSFQSTKFQTEFTSEHKFQIEFQTEFVSEYNISD